MKKIYILAVAMLALVACDNNDDNPITSQVVANITATIGESAQSRAVDTQWGNGDKIGITTIFQSKVGPFVNMEYTTESGDGVFTGNMIYIYNPMSVTAYYPFRGTENTAPGIISASTTADKQTSAKQLEFDYLYASLSDVNTDNPNVTLNFAHKMSKITFIFTKGDGADVSKINSYTIDKLVLDGTFNPATGDCAAKKGVDAQELTLDLPEGSVSNNVALPSLIVFPQELETVMLKIKDSEGQYYTCNLTIEDGALKAGNHYQYTVKVSKTEVKLQKTTITDWETSDLEGNASSADDEE